MSNAVDTAKKVQAAGCSCIGLLLFAPIMLLGLAILWSLFKGVVGL